MKHQETYYTCNNCDTRLPAEFTEVRVFNNDPVSGLPEQEYHLCAMHWLEISALLDKAATLKARAADEAAKRWDKENDVYRQWDDRPWE